VRLAAKMLKNVANVNNWQYANQAYVQAGQPNTVYFQIVDLDKLPGVELSSVLPDFPLRYMSTATALAVEATFPSLDDDTVLIKAASQPFPQDLSIWQVSLASTETPSSGTFTIKLTEDGVDRYLKSIAGVSVTSLNDGAC